MLEKIKNNYVLLSILTVAAFIRFYHIDFQSIWLDEVITMIECNSKISFKESYDIMALRENNPMLYYFSVKIICSIFGNTTFVVRAISALIGTICVYAIYLLGKEIQNKRTGLIAATLLTVNYCHLLYSQEARPYCLLTLFTILAFYQLVIFIKDRTLKNAILFGLFAALMINTHFFGLFVLVSQFLIVLYFLIDATKKERLKFLLLSALAGVITIALWIPSIKLFLIAADLKVFWIPAPTLDVYTNIFKEFFGNAESVLLICLVLMVFYFIKIFNSTKEDGVELTQNKNIFSFIIISIWIFITMFIPLVRSYLQIPMIISRYMIVVLPAAILLLAQGISFIKSKSVQNIVISLFVIASLTDIVVVKSYYTKINKTQFREIAEAVNEKNDPKALIVSPWAWHFNYFFNNETFNNELKEKTLQDYVDAVRSKSEEERDFWFIDANAHPYQLNPVTEEFLTANYNQVQSTEFFDTWARHYISKNSTKSNSSGINLKDFTPSNLDNQGNILMFRSSTIKSEALYLQAGSYILKIDANSLPQKPINGENAHLIVKLGDKEIGNYYLSEKPEMKEKIIPFENTVNQHCKITLTYDNDLSVNNLGRNLIIYNIKIEKK